MPGRRHINNVGANIREEGTLQLSLHAVYAIPDLSIPRRLPESLLACLQLGVLCKSKLIAST
jgi:hypothetical protein